MKRSVLLLFGLDEKPERPKKRPFRPYILYPVSDHLVIRFLFDESFTPVIIIGGGGGELGRGRGRLTRDAENSNAVDLASNYGEIGRRNWRL